MFLNGDELAAGLDFRFEVFVDETTPGVDIFPPVFTSAFIIGLGTLAFCDSSHTMAA
jgi:hypothetical protein